MKNLVLFFAGVFSLVSFIYSNAESDPFGVKISLKSLSKTSPSVAYAASSSIVDGYQPAASNVIVWDSVDSHDTGVFSNSFSKDDVDALCFSPSKELKKHPKYNMWCNK